MSKSISKFVAAAVIYAGFAVYLYQPYFKLFHKLQYLIVANVCLASLGCFVLSRRWVGSFWGSFFAGAVYGFGPFLLGLARFHPTAGLLAAGIPWLFCPAAFGSKARWQWLGIPLSALPFLAIVLFFQVTAHYRLFAIPIQAELHLADLAGLFAPLIMVNRSVTVIGFYRVPIAPLMIGFSMLLAARRFGVLVIFGIGTVLAFSGCLFNISPIIWLAIPVLCCSVLVGVGTQGLVCASFADRKWVLVSSVVMLSFALVALLLATKYFQVFGGLGDEYAGLLAGTAKMYVLGAIVAAVIFFITRARLRIHWLRLAVLCLAMAVDVFLGARFIVDKIF
ncbi:MAG: hypothetical protein ACYS0C_08445 [Planctomycetota bacterium]|jgi:hypothetical protein